MTDAPDIPISICIPAYRNIAFLKRLLDSITKQTFTRYEVIITDDSPDSSVKDFIDGYSFLHAISYYKNSPALGTPENWNEGIRRAKGKWIKIMHNDDWFERSDALQVFYDATQNYPDTPFFFAAFQNMVEDTGKKEVVRCSVFDLLFLRLSPYHLVKRVYIGNPSCTFIRRDAGIFYDKRFKFVVDFEYYIRCIRRLKKYKYIDEVLIDVGFHKEQVTQYTFLVPEVQIPENFQLLEQWGLKVLRNPVVYDYYWRMFRNLKIRSVEQIQQYYKGETPVLLRQMIQAQARISPGLLRNGIVSKLLMSAYYILSLFRRH